MTDPPALGTGSPLAFNAPLSDERADRLARDLAATQPSTVVDVGCGWGELLLLGVEFWERPPSADELAAMWDGITADACTDLHTLVGQVIAAGLRPLRVEVATREEWDAFQSGFVGELEHWLVRHGDHGRAPAVRAQLDQAYRIWLRGHRDVMGFAYLTLGVPTVSTMDTRSG